MRKYNVFTDFGKIPYILGFISLKRDYDRDMLSDIPINNKWDKIKILLTRDKDQNLRPELCTIFSNAVGGCFVGAGLGGFLYARIKLEDYVKTNQVTTYRNVLDAKMRMQDHVNLQFMKGAFHWGTRIGFFTGMFSVFYIVIGVLIDNHSVWNLAPAGFLSGAIYKIPLGPRGIIAGGIGGGILGLIGSTLTFLILTFSNKSFEDHMMWNYHVVNTRDAKFSESKKSELLRLNDFTLDEISPDDHKKSDEKKLS